MTPVFSGRTKLAISLAKYGFARSVCQLFVSLLATRQEVTKKRAQAFPPGHPLSVPRYKVDWGERHLYPAASPAALPPRAAVGGRKSFFFLGRGWRLDSPFWRQAQKTKSFCLKFCLTRVRRRWQKLLQFRLRAPSVSAFLFKTPTQKLKMQPFAKK